MGTIHTLSIHQIRDKIVALDAVDSGIKDELLDRIDACRWVALHLTEEPDLSYRLQRMIVTDLQDGKSFKAQYAHQVRKELQELYGKDVDSTPVLGAFYLTGTLNAYQLKRLINGPNVHSRIKPDEDPPFLDTTPA